jgi:hypothetical protein
VVAILGFDPREFSDDDDGPGGDKSYEACPVCRLPAVKRCRCTGPHTEEQLKQGHGLSCENGHSWSGSTVYDPDITKGLQTKYNPNHDALGRFATGSGGGFSPQAALDNLSSWAGNKGYEDRLIGIASKVLDPIIKETHADQIAQDPTSESMYGARIVRKGADTGLEINGLGAAAVKTKIMREVGARMKEKLGETSDAALQNFLNSREVIVSGVVKNSAKNDSELAAGLMVKSWATSSSDNDVVSQSVQLAVARRMGMKTHHNAIELADIPEEFSHRVGRHYLDHQKVYDAYADSVYENTQSQLKAMGVESMTAYRGMTFGPRKDLVPKWVQEVDKSPTRIQHGEKTNITSPAVDNIPVRLNPVSSFATELDTASTFAMSDDGLRYTSVLAGMQVPREKIWSTAWTGPGCFNENEIVVLHDDSHRARVVAYNSDRDFQQSGEFNVPFERAKHFWGKVE